MLLKKDQLFDVFHGDCIEHMYDMPKNSVDFSIFSPPFPATFSYTESEKDIGNSEDLKHEAKIHMGFFYKAIRPIIKPGRVMVVHVAQIHKKRRDGEVGMFDFRGLNIRLAQRAGFIYEYDWLVTKNPQAQAIRTKSRQLQFSGLEANRAESRGTLGDYLIKFKVPGEAKIVVNSKDQVSRNEWIQWAEAAWTDIKETNTLNVREGRGENDTRHICPLQLDVIDRLVRMYSNPGEIVFSPFAGIASELHTALKLGRRAYGCELKDEYYAAALKNCKRALLEKGKRQSLHKTGEE